MSWGWLTPTPHPSLHSHQVIHKVAAKWVSGTHLYFFWLLPLRFLPLRKIQQSREFIHILVEENKSSLHFLQERNKKYNRFFSNDPVTLLNSKIVRNYSEDLHSRMSLFAVGPAVNTDLCTLVKQISQFYLHSYGII